MARTTKRRRSMKKVKKMRGGGDCDKANTNMVSKSNAITEGTFISDMKIKIKRDRFIELVSNGEYNEACLNNFIEIIQAEVDELNGQLDWAKSQKSDKENAPSVQIYLSLRNEEKNMLNGLKENIYKKLPHISHDAIYTGKPEDFSGSNDSTSPPPTTTTKTQILGALSSHSSGLLKHKPGKKKGGKSRKQKSKR